MKKKILKTLVIIAIVVLAILGIYNLIKYFQVGNQKVSIVASNNYYLGDNLEAIAEITSDKIIDKGSIKVRLINADKKNVKAVKGKFEIDESGFANINLKIPEDIEIGKYYLEVTAKTNRGKDKVKKDISIQNINDTNIIVNLDKGIYKPGDTVNYRTLITYKKNDEPVSEDTKISIYDGNDNRVYVEEAKSSEYGILSGNFKLADEVNSGTYKIKVETRGQEFTKYFNVNPYVLPQYQVKIETDKENYIIEDNAKITVNAEYFFGEKVKGADVKLKIGDQELKGTTDENGKFETNYTLTQIGKTNIYATVVDTSNYMIEEQKTIVTGTDLFEVKLMPINGDIYDGISNDVFVFTSKADGTPVKAYLDITSGKFKRQVVTDEKGIGKFTLTSSDISSLEKYTNNENDIYNNYNYNNNSGITFRISAKDMEGNIIEKNNNFSVVKNYGTIISTDKVKYNVGETINLKINSSNDISKILYVCKGEKLIKTITTSEENIDFDLEDTYGLVDIYVLNSGTYRNNYYKNANCKRTIFIKPSKQLNIDIATDKQEYKPSDNMKLSIGLTDENKNSVDAALLVSILDDAVLNLADNDLSIDNIKMALEDIEFSDDLDAATVYANIVDDSSESALMGLLLKQNSNADVNKNDLYPEKYKYEYQELAIIFLVLSAILAGIYFAIKYKKLGNVLSHLIAIIGLFLIFSVALYEWLYYDLDLSYMGTLFICGAITFISYVLFFYKQRDYLTKGILRYIGLIILAYILYSILYSLFDIYDNTVWVIILLILPVIYTVLVAMSRNGKNVDKLKKFVLRLLVSEIIFGVSLFIFKEPITLVVVLVLDYIYEFIISKKIDKSTIEEIKDKTKIAKENEVLSIAGVLIVIIVVLIGMYIYSSSTNSINTGLNSMSTQEFEDFSPRINTSTGSGLDWTDAKSSINMYDGAVGGADASIARNPLGNVFDSFTGSKSIIEEANSAYNETEFVEEKQESEDTNIRNVFLESLCFIPELVSEQGKVSKEIKLSDNITTWQIQVVGNTKDGKIGSSQSSFKVFKEFFVDFTMPTNSVVGDKVSLPLTAFNYTEKSLNISLNVVKDEWFNIGEYETNITIEPGQTKLVYLPIEIIKAGENKLRVEAKAEGLSDIIEKTMTTKENGIEISNVIASGTFEDKIDLDVLYLQNYKQGTGKIKVKLYSTAMSQAVEGIENIFKMPTGCFEQVSSSLYPDILALEYLENSKLENDEIKQKALEYIKTGYQKLLTYEVAGQKGGYSLYGHSPAEVVLTSYGLMEFKDLSNVYNVEDKVIENMKEFIFSNQKTDGSFKTEETYGSSHVVGNYDKLTMNAYTIWALSESFPDDKRLEKSIEYLENNLDKATDNYTLALIANSFANTKSKKTDSVINKLMKNIQTDSDGIKYFNSNLADYYGTRGTYQNLQTTALISLALTKTNSNSKTNLELVNYIVSKKDAYGTWGTTQGTILALKALIEYEGKTTIGEQEIKIKLNNEEKVIKVEKNNLDVYEEVFDNVQKENKLSMDLKKGKLYYEVIQDYYVDYSEYKEENTLGASYTITEQANVNDTITQNIKIENTSKENIVNGMLEINIPQGCSVKEESLNKLVIDNIIEKYEYNYGKIGIYLKNFGVNEYKDLKVEYKANYPVSITGAQIRLYDYYNPDIQAIAMPTLINVK